MKICEVRPEAYKTAVERAYKFDMRVDMYYDKYGHGWSYNMQTDLVAVTVHWCVRDMIDEKMALTKENVKECYYQYEYHDLFESVGAILIKPSDWLLENLVDTYIPVAIKCGCNSCLTCCGCDEPIAWVSCICDDYVPN